MSFLNGTLENSEFSGQIDKLNCEKVFALSREFSAGKGMNMLVGQNLLPESGDFRGYSIGVACSCAIFHHLSKDFHAAENSVEKVQFFALDTYMEVSADTLYSLEIFSTESHPNSTSGGYKEGFSLFNIINFTKSGGGKALLRQWLSKPSCNKAEIDRRLDNVQFFAESSNRSIIEEIWVVLRKTKNIPTIFSSLHFSPKISDFENLYKMCKLLNQFMKSFDALNPKCQVLNELHSLYRVEVCGKFEEEIAVSIDFEKSDETGRISFKSGVNQQLDQLKDSSQLLAQIFAALVEEISSELKIPDTNDVKPVYYTQLGYLVAIPFGYKLRLPDSYQIQKANNETIYVKDSRMYELDEQFGDIHSCIVDLEIELLQELKESLLCFKQEIIDISLKLFEIDVLISFAEATRRFNLTRPKLENSGAIEARQCRHLLAESACENFIPNDICLNSEKISILTGPNFSGKSVYLKQIGILCIMAQTGCFVPAAKATIGIVDKIFTKISTKESVVSRNSSFQLELDQILNAIQHSTKNSLLLADEFGKGTEFNDGIGLFCSVVHYLSKLNSNTPKVLFTTHFHEAFQFLNDESRFRWLKMDIIFEQRLNNLAFLYKLKEGISSNSFGCICAKLSGIPTEIVSRAENISEKYSKFLPIEPIDVAARYQQARLFCDALVEILQQNDIECSFDKLLDYNVY